MIVEAPLDAHVATELWVSFVSLLRSYSGAASLNGERHEVFDRGDGFATVQAGTERLSVLFSFSRGTIACVIGGACNCAYYSEEFRFQEDGRLVSKGKARELDDVVIELLHKLKKPAGQKAGDLQ